MDYNGLTVFEYITANGDIFKTTDPMYTTDMKVAINRMLKYNYREKILLYETPTEVQDLVDMLLYDNQHKYKNQFLLMQNILPVDYTDKQNDTSTKANTGNQTVTDTSTKANTGTVGNSGSVTKDNTGTVANVVADTLHNTGTVVDASTGTVSTETNGTIGVTTDSKLDPINTQTSKVGFDGGALIVTDKSENNLNHTYGTNDSITSNTDVATTDMTNTKTNNLTQTDAKTETMTNDLKEAVIDTSTVTNNLTETLSASNVRVDALSEALTSEVKDINVSIRLQELITMQENTARLLYRQIAEDVIGVIAIRTWE